MPPIALIMIIKLLIISMEFKIVIELIIIIELTDIQTFIFN